MNKLNKDEKLDCIKQALKHLDKNDKAGYFEFMRLCLLDQSLLSALEVEYISGKDDSNFANRLKAYANTIRSEVEQETDVVTENQQEDAEFETPTSNADAIEHPLIRVLLMGTAQTGKSCFLMGLYQYLLKSGSLTLNFDDTSSPYHKGNVYIQKIHTDWRDNQVLPPGGAEEEVYQTKWWYQTMFTCEKFDLEFVDFSGEDMKRFGEAILPTVLPPFLQEENTLKFWFVSCENISMMRVQEIINLVSYLKRENIKQYSNLYVIFSKCDLCEAAIDNSGLTIEEFKELTEKHIKVLGDYFFFSLGDFSNALPPKRLEDKYYKPIVEQILKHI